MALNFYCPICENGVAVPGTLSVSSVECSKCGTHLDVTLFANMGRPVEVGLPAPTLTDPSDASCYNHSTKMAVGGCDSCGKLLCSVCSLAVENKHFCPDCILLPGVIAAYPQLENERLCEEKSVWFTALCGLYPAFICLTVPATVVLSIVYWSRPGSLIGHSRSWMIGGILLAIFSPIVLIALCLGIGVAVAYIAGTVTQTHT